jgi:hypothetical protein
MERASTSRVCIVETPFDLVPDSARIASHTQPHPFGHSWPFGSRDTRCPLLLVVFPLRVSDEKY